METYPVSPNAFGVRIEEPEDDSEEDKALALATTEDAAAGKDSSKKGCLKIETQKRSLGVIYNVGLTTRKASFARKSILKNEENLEETGHTCNLSESESSHRSVGIKIIENGGKPETVSGESSSEKANASSTTNDGNASAPIAGASVSVLPSVTTPPARKCLTWGRVEIRNYDLTIGDNPACLAGAPIQISWDFDSKVINVPVDEYETHRPPRRKQRQLFLNREVRDKMLREYGFKRTDISKAVRQANIDRNNRKTTVMNMKFTWFYELSEGFCRKMKKSLCGFNDKNEIEKLWQRAEMASEKGKT